MYSMQKNSLFLHKYLVLNIVPPISWIVLKWYLCFFSFSEHKNIKQVHPIASHLTTCSRTIKPIFLFSSIDSSQYSQAKRNHIINMSNIGTEPTVPNLLAFLQREKQVRPDAKSVLRKNFKPLILRQLNFNRLIILHCSLPVTESVSAKSS